MTGVELFLEQYGLLAIFLIMLVKSAGLPIPIPAGVLMLATAARAAQGKLSLWQAFVAILFALVVGSLVQFWLARGAGRGLFYRYGGYVGLNQSRLDTAAIAVRKSGPIGIALSILTPGLRVVSVAACGLADVPLATFLPGVVLGSGAFLALHFFLGYVGGTLLAPLLAAVPLPALLAVALLALGAVAWVVVRHVQYPRASGAEVVADGLRAWEEATCPACLILGGTSLFGLTASVGSLAEVGVVGPYV